MGAAGRGAAWIVAGIRGSLPTSGTGRRAVRRASGARPRPFLVFIVTTAPEPPHQNPGNDLPQHRGGAAAAYLGYI